jgi:hypothetical protein
MRAPLSCLVILLASAGCGSSHHGGSGFGQDSGVGTLGGGGPDGSSPLLGDGASGVDAGGNGNCPQSTQSVYTLAADDSLYSFDPPSLTFTLIGVLHCPGFASPYSMAVDRKGQAWVLYSDGNVYTVDTSNAACATTSFVPNQNGFQRRST